MMRRGNLLMRKKSPNKWNNEPQYYHWTTSAIQCYMRGCVCDGCFYQNFFSDKNHKCQMKIAIMSLIRNNGLPKFLKRKSIIEE